MNQSSAEESLMALLEAMLTLAAGSEASRQPPKPTVIPGGYPEEQFLDLTEEERDELSCSICYQILKETMQCVNHHKFCHSCLVVWSTTGDYANRNKCPVCRTRGYYYFRNGDIDTKVADKRVKCHVESCSWTGLVKYLASHRHDTYGEDSVTEVDNKGTDTSSSIPRLEQVAPRAPPATTARFVGTGLTLRNSNIDATQQIVSTPRVSLLPGRTASRASSTSINSNSQETIIEIGRGRGRRGVGTSSLQVSRRPMPPVRATANNHITFSHSQPNTNTDANNSIEGAAGSPQSRASMASTNGTMEGLSNSTLGGFAPRPPSTPRTSSNSVNPRRLPRINNTLPSHNRVQQTDPLETPAITAVSNESRNDTGTNLGNIRNHLQDSRNRLNNLMSSFSSELDRNRQEMMQFQHERENQRREQLEEVRQLSQRLGQVAFELRRLLEHRRRMPSFSDSESEDD